MEAAPAMRRAALVHCVGVLHHKLELSDQLAEHESRLDWLEDITPRMTQTLGGAIAMGYCRSLVRLFDLMVPWLSDIDEFEDCQPLTVAGIHFFLSLEGWTRTVIHDPDFRAFTDGTLTPEAR